jgi:hypothetical protein
MVVTAHSMAPTSRAISLARRPVKSGLANRISRGAAADESRLHGNQDNH